MNKQAEQIILQQVVFLVRSEKFVWNFYILSDSTIYNIVLV